MIPFLVGLVIGISSSFAAYSGRLSTLESESKAHSDAIVELHQQSQETQKWMIAIATKLGVTK